MTRKPTDFDGSVEVIHDPEANRALLLHPQTPVEIRSRGRGRCFAIARVGLSVIAISGLCLVPASSLAEDGGVAANDPVVTAACEITDELPDGTPSGILESGDVCVLPPAGPPTPADPSPAAPQPPADAPQAPAEPAAPAPTGSATADVPAAAPAAADTAANMAATASTASPAAGLTKKPSARKAEQVSSKSVSGKAAPKGTTTTPTKRAQPRSAKKLRHTTKGRFKNTQSTSDLQKDVGAIAVDGPLKPPFYVNDEAVIPRFLIKLYKQAGKRYDIPWPILAAINEIETDFGRNVAVSSAGAVGWMQFMPATWKAYGVDADKDGVKDPNNPRDAIFAAARYLHAAGAPNNMRRAIFAYNHAGWYVDSVLLRAERIADQQGERSRTLYRLFETSGRRLEQQVLADPRITLYDCGREDIEAGRIDRRVLILLRFLAWSGLHPTVTSLECGHGYYTKSGNVSHHSSGNAVDISAINGVPIFGHQGSGSVTEATIRELLTLRGAMRPDQIISLMTFERADNTFAMGDHADHIHVGFAPLKPTNEVPLSWRLRVDKRMTTIAEGLARR